MRWSTSDVIDHSACEMELKHNVVKIGVRYGPEGLFSIIGGAHCVR